MEGRADVVIPTSKQIPSFIIRTGRLILCRKINAVPRAIQNTQMHSRAVCLNTRPDFTYRNLWSLKN